MKSSLLGKVAATTGKFDESASSAVTNIATITPAADTAMSKVVTQGQTKWTQQLTDNVTKLSGGIDDALAHQDSQVTKLDTDLGNQFRDAKAKQDKANQEKSWWESAWDSVTSFMGDVFSFLGGMVVGFFEAAWDVLAETDLRDALLGGIQYAGGDLYGSLAAGAIFDGASLAGANLAKATFDEASFAGADLRGASLLRSSLCDATLARADLRDVDLRKAYLARADLTGADLTGAKLAGAALAGAKLEGARADWIDIGRDAPERIDGTAASDWLAAQARGG